MTKKCEICGNSFIPNRKWHKYCLPECKQKGKVQNTIKWRKKQVLNIKKLSVKEIKNNEPHKSFYYDVMVLFQKSHKKKLLWNELWMQTRVKDKTKFNGYITTFCRLGILKKKKKGYILSKRYQFEPIKLKGRDIIMNTDMECIIFRNRRRMTSSWMYINPWFSNKQIRFYVKNLKEKVKKIEDHISKADDIWIRILAETRDNYIKEHWEKIILKNKNINALTKFDFCLDIILELREGLWLESVSPDDRSIKKQVELLREVAEEALNTYIQNKYPMLTSSQIEKMLSNATCNYEENKDFLDDFRKKIIFLAMVNSLEHVILIEGLVSFSEKDGLKKMGVDNSLSIDVNKPIREYRRKEELFWKKKPMQDELTNLEQEIFKESIDEELYIKTPFFRHFFHGFEKSLMELVFKKGTDDNKLKDFFKDLDRTTKMLKIHALPDDPTGLLL